MHRPTARRSLGALIFLLATLALTGPPARAHAALVASEPAAGSTVAMLDRVVLRFDSAVDVTNTHIWLEDATRVIQLGSAETVDDDPSVVTAAVPSVTPGSYSIGFHAVAADGVPLTGSVDLTIDPAPAPIASTSGTGGTTPMLWWFAAAAVLVPLLVRQLVTRLVRVRPKERLAR